MNLDRAVRDALAAEPPAAAGLPPVSGVGEALAAEASLDAEAAATPEPPGASPA